MLLAVLVSSISCKKIDHKLAEQLESPVTGTRAELTLDSIFLYAKHTYLWNNVIPGYQKFNPRNYLSTRTELLNCKQALFELCDYAINPNTSLPYEKTALPGLSKYSFIEAGSNDQSGKQASLATDVTAAVHSYQRNKCAYLDLDQFAHLNVVGPELDAAFLDFSAAGVDTLIIDLRDNNGGYVETAEYLANLVALPDMNGKVMYSQHFNSEMQKGKAGILRNQLYLDENNNPVNLNGRKATYADVDFSVTGNTYVFEKKGAVNNLKAICFLVNGGTASASELLINCLKPYFDITILGSRTYGKPVGSFGIKIDGYIMHIANFQVKNAAGSGDYFDGMIPDIAASDTEIGFIANDVIINTLNLVRRKKGDRTSQDTAMDKQYDAVDVNPRLMIKEKVRLKE